MHIEDLIQRRGKTIPTKQPLSIEIKKSISLLIFTLLLIIVLIVMVFLFNTTQDAQKGYMLKQEQLRQGELESQQNILKSKIIEIKTYNKLENNPLVKTMTKPEKIEFIEEKKTSN